MKKSILAIMMASIMLMTIGSVCCTVSAEKYEKAATSCTLEVTIKDYGFNRLDDKIIGNSVSCKGRSAPVFKEGGQYKAIIEGLSPGVGLVTGRWPNDQLKLRVTPVVLGYGLVTGGTDDRSSTTKINVGIQSYSFFADLLEMINNMFSDRD
jgi:hypothetical protein